MDTPASAPQAGAAPVAAVPPHTAMEQGRGASANAPAAPDVSSSTGDIKHLERIIKGVNTAMLVTHGSDGLHARPMGVACVEFDPVKEEAIYFVTHSDTTKVSEIRANSEVALIFQDGAHNRWASVSATAQLMEDPGKAKEVWSPMYNAWFPNGPETPGVLLVKAIPTCATYWEGMGLGLNRLNILFSALTSRITKKPVKMEMTQQTKTVVFPGSPKSGTATQPAPAATA